MKLRIRTFSYEIEPGQPLSQTLIHPIINFTSTSFNQSVTETFRHARQPWKPSVSEPIKSRNDMAEISEFILMCYAFSGMILGAGVLVAEILGE